MFFDWFCTNIFPHFSDTYEKKNNCNFTEKENNATWYIAHNIIVLLYCSKGRFNHYHCIYLVCGFNINLNLKVQRKKQIWLRFYTMKIYPGQTGYFNTVEIIQIYFIQHLSFSNHKHVQLTHFCSVLYLLGVIWNGICSFLNNLTCSSDLQNSTEDNNVFNCTLLAIYKNTAKNFQKHFVKQLKTLFN